MKDFKDLFPNNLYHSYIIEADPLVTPELLKTFFEDRGDIEKSSRDVLCQTYNSFDVKDSARIKEWHSEKSISGKRLCIIGTKFINHDAGRTLLKMIEEPADDTHFFIVVPNSNILLDTILSRAHLIKINKTEDKLNKKNVEEFLNSLPKDRIETVASLIEDHKKDEDSGGIRYSAIELVNELERIIYKKWQENKKDKDLQFSLDELSKARDYLSLPGSSTKMILEHIALVI